MIRVFEAFSGYGSQSLALKRLNIKHQVVAISEIDKYAIEAYKALHGDVLNLGDITQIKVKDIPDHDLFTYSFPCQDISVAGKQQGLDKGSGTRSGLLWECERIIESKKPKYLLMENVKNLVGKQNKPNFDIWCEWLETQGYANYWQVLNAKDYGIPQNRERVFMVSILGEHKPYVFPKGLDNGLRLKDFLEDEVDEKYYISEEKTNKLISQIKDKNSILLDMSQSKTENKEREYTDFSPTLSARDFKDPRLINVCAIPCITPGRIDKRQNGRRFKEDGDPMFTLTSQDRHGVLQVGNYRQGKDKFDNPQAGRVYDASGISPTLNTMQGGHRQPCVIEPLK